MHKSNEIHSENIQKRSKEQKNYKERVEKKKNY